MSVAGLEHMSPESVAMRLNHRPTLVDIVWRKISLLYFQYYLYFRKFISQVVFFLEVESIEVNIQTISVATLTEIEAALTFELTSGASFFVLTVEQFALTVRSSSTFTFALSTSIITDHLVQIQIYLLEQWAAVVTEAESVVIVIQETAVTFEG